MAQSRREEGGRMHTRSKDRSFKMERVETCDEAIEDGTMAACSSDMLPLCRQAAAAAAGRHNANFKLQLAALALSGRRRWIKFLAAR